MPTLLRERGYRVYFYSHEPNEPPHLHVDKDGKSAKFWLLPLQLSWNMGYSAKELNEIHDLLLANQTLLWDGWHGYFGTSI
ncbi:MAG: DUF4160 domain-containing protein [Magnetococcales bacterium]|nr:DUF4160 domain-containing protein [Magnetococcales bacterium]NGZ27308.1 DUF4160 domain-containing protein [Magnetococcales bacterium]